MDGLENEVKNEIEIDRLRDDDWMNDDCDHWREILEMPEIASLPKNDTEMMLLGCGMSCPGVCPAGQDRALDQ